MFFFKMGNMYSSINAVVNGVMYLCIGLANTLRCRHCFFFFVLFFSFPYAESPLRIIGNFIGKSEVDMFCVHYETWC